jgi:hypothetical protein
MTTINDIKAFAKGETYTINVADYNEAMSQANEAKERITEQFPSENPYIFTTIFPFRKRGDRYCIEVWMQYTDMTASKDIRVRFFFSKNWFAAARKAVADRRASQEANKELWGMFGF